MSNPFTPTELQICVPEHDVVSVGRGETQASGIPESAISCGLAEGKCHICGKLYGNI